MTFWICVGAILTLALIGALVLDRRRGGGSVGGKAADAHTQAAAEVEANRFRTQQGGWGSGS